MAKIKWGVILAVIGGVLAIVGPFLTGYTTTATITAKEIVTSQSWVEEYPVTYLCVAGGILAVIVGIVSMLKPRVALAWGLLIGVFVIMVAMGLLTAMYQTGVDIGSESLEGGIAQGIGFGLAGVLEAETSFEIALEIGSYCLLASIVLTALAAPLVALKR